MLENNQKELILLEDLGMEFPKETSIQKRRYGIFKCFCGNAFKAQIQSIKTGNTTSCGCINGIHHGLTYHKLYHCWKDMIRRCINQKCKNYKHYGARGITVCNEWLDINNFINDMFPTYQEGLSIDRIDVNGNYEPNNCRWTTKSIQNRNTRKIKSNNTSGYRGVSFDKSRKKWFSSIRINNKQINLGRFNNILEAAKTYDNYVIANNLEHTRNFN